MNVKWLLITVEARSLNKIITGHRTSYFVGYSGSFWAYFFRERSSQKPNCSRECN